MGQAVTQQAWHQAVREIQGRTRAFFESGYAFVDGYPYIKRCSFAYCFRSWFVFMDVTFLPRYLIPPSHNKLTTIPLLCCLEFFKLGEFEIHFFPPNELYVFGPTQRLPGNVGRQAGL